MTTEFVLVTGKSGAGKTNWCSRFAADAREVGVSVGGLLSPANISRGRKHSIDLVDLVTGATRQLAKRNTQGCSGLHTKHWCFDSATLAWGNEVLQGLKDVDLVIIDELGPLELRREEGLVEALRVLDELRFPKIYGVVRPSLMPEAMERWPQARIHDLGSQRSHLDRPKVRTQ